MSYLPHDIGPTPMLGNSIISSTWPSGQNHAEVTGMRTIFAIVMTIALLALGGVAGYTFQAHQTPILALDGGNGPGG